MRYKFSSRNEAHILELKVLLRLSILELSPFLNRVAVCTAKAAYSQSQTIPFNHLSVSVSVTLSVCLSSGLWKNSRSDPDAVWHGRSDGPWTVSYTHLTLPTNREV